MTEKDLKGYNINWGVNTPVIDNSKWDCLIVDDNKRVVGRQGERGMSKQRAEKYKMRTIFLGFIPNEVMVVPFEEHYGIGDIIK